MDSALTDDYLAMTWELRRAGVPTELYVGMQKGPGKQLRYADQYEIPLVILYGSNEKSQASVTIKDMSVGREKAKDVGDRREWLAARPGQVTAPRAELVETVKRMLASMSSPS